MGWRTRVAGTIVAGGVLCGGPPAAAEPVAPPPIPSLPIPGLPFPAPQRDMPTVEVPSRTAISVRSILPDLKWGTPNQHEVRSGLSVVKLYVVDYALRHGDGAAQDRELGERMIRFSDDGAADTLAAKYPAAIDAVAKEYGLTETHGSGGWGTASTSTADVADFLAAKLRDDPDSPILGWMAAASDTAADGTKQDWGTARLPRVTGTKWGWADQGIPEVASASFGPGFTVSAHTYGTAAEQTDDVTSVVPQVLGEFLESAWPWTELERLIEPELRRQR